MKKIFLIPLLLLCTSLGMQGRAQYTGGSADGYTSAALTHSSCSVLSSTNIYNGGASGAAGSSSELVASICTIVSSSNIYQGGDAGGAASGSLIASVCPAPANTNIYFGGDADGHASASLISSVCPPPPNTNIYFGGDADGASSGNLIATVCPAPVNTNIYFGGDADGHAFNILIHSACVPLSSSNIYLGGGADGFSYGKVINTPSPCTILPVDLMSFTGNCYNQQRVLRWTTASESSSKDFTVQVSAAGTDWKTAGVIPASGNSSATQSYTFTDPRPADVLSYYRLQQADLNGKLSYSGVITIEACAGPGGPDNLTILPNPSAGVFYLGFTGDKARVRSIEVFNILGQKIYHAEGYQSRIDLSDKQAGIYFIHFDSENKTLTQKILIER